MIQVVGNPSKIYRRPEDIIRDDGLDQDRQIRLLEKLLRLATERYLNDRSLSALNNMRWVNRALSDLRRAATLAD